MQKKHGAIVVSVVIVFQKLDRAVAVGSGLNEARRRSAQLFCRFKINT